jgi:hypothetical protein
MTTFHIVNIPQAKVVDSHELEAMIENIQTHQNYITVITSDLEE